MDIPSKYDPSQIEKKWYSEWEKNECFCSSPNPKKKPYTVVMPPPNVTGILHMGHILNNTIQDVLVRKARMEGRETCWIPGTDHASIATEAKVVKMLEKQGISKQSLSRSEFLAHAFEWKNKYGGVILKQLRKMGASCDWSRTHFTMDEDYSKEVIQVFVDLYNKGLIYKGIRMVNWDPTGQTAISDEEVIRKEVESHLYYIKYQVVDAQGAVEDDIVIATTRPETIPADTAICVNPEDVRYQHLIGKEAVVPIVNRKIPIISDEYVDPAFGTGCLKVTPAHDINDYELGQKYGLKIINLLHDDGTLNENAQAYKGMDRFDARKKIVKDFENENILVKKESIKNNVGFSERTDAVVEPKLSMQWFLKMKDLAKPALENVENGTIQFHPKKFINTYKHWMNNIKDWCISRQLWWGHRIPAWHLPNNTFIVAPTLAEALLKAKKINKDWVAADLRQEEDVLDTWASSWLWPISVFKGISNPENEDFKYYFPTNDLVTAPEILFFWVARMVMASYEYTQQPPFQNVYLTGIVRDKLHRKMSKSLGNSPDPLEIMAQYGADGVRVGMLFSSPAGNDLLFDEKLIEQGRNFANKIWNAFRLIQGWDAQLKDPITESLIAEKWFNAKINAAIQTIESLFSQYKISDALMVIYKLIWQDFCGNYLEMIKPPQGEKIAKHHQQSARKFLDVLLRILHPFMPFITEEIWQYNSASLDNKKTDFLMLAEWPKIENFDNQLIKNGQIVLDLITEIRSIKTTHGIAKKVSLPLYIKSPNPKVFLPFTYLMQKMAIVEVNISGEETISDVQTITINEHTFFVVLAGFLDKEKEKEKLKKELDYIKGFKIAVEKKLQNTRFIENAPEQVIANERKKLADAQTKIKTLTKSLGEIDSTSPNT